MSILVHEDLATKELNVNVPEHIESIWLSTRPNWLPRAISVIVVAGIYYPGSGSDYAPEQEDIILHVTETVHQLYQKYVNPLFIIMGDFNDLDVKEICDINKLKQVVNVPTRKDATLDLILTNNDNEFYKKPLTLPSIHNSDHLCVLYEPTTNQRKKSSKKHITVRRFRKSSMLKFGFWITRFKWSELMSIRDVNLKITYFLA